MIPQEMTPQERYSAIMWDVCETQFILLKHRIGQLEELPEAEKKTFQDFCDSALLILESLLKGEPDIKALEDFNGRFQQKGAAGHGKSARPAGNAGGYNTGAAGRTFRP